MINESNNQVGTIKVKNKLLGRIIIFIGLVFLTTIFSYITYSITIRQVNFVNKSNPSEGTVISFSENRNRKNGNTYAPVVEYKDEQGNTQTFKSALSSNRPSYKIGQRVNILVPNDGDTPQISYFMDLWFGSIITSIFALIAWLILILTTYSTIKKWRMLKLLAKNGVVIQAKVLSVDESSYNPSTNASLSWLIQAQWLNPQDNKVYNFESEDIMYNPKDFLGDTIDVTILPQDPSVYEMNISKLPMAGN